jgi:hypothetical protein
MTTTFITFLDGFIAKNGNGNYRHLLQWFCYEKGDDNNVITFLHGGGVMKKVRGPGGFLFFFF